MDFVPDQLAPDRRFRVLNIVDDFSRESVAQIPGLSISGQRVARELDRLNHPLTETIVCDNGLELTSKAMFFWSKQTGVKLHRSLGKKPPALFAEEAARYVHTPTSDLALLRGYGH